MHAPRLDGEESPGFPFFGTIPYRSRRGALRSCVSQHESAGSPVDLILRVGQEEFLLHAERHGALVSTHRSSPSLNGK